MVGAKLHFAICEDRRPSAHSVHLSSTCFFGLMVVGSGAENTIPTLKTWSVNNTWGLGTNTSSIGCLGQSRTIPRLQPKKLFPGVKAISTYVSGTKFYESSMGRELTAWLTLQRACCLSRFKISEKFLPVAGTESSRNRNFDRIFNFVPVISGVFNVINVK
jgi:hypothetical protein